MGEKIGSIFCVASSNAAEGRRSCVSQQRDERNFKATGHCDWLVACLGTDRGVVITTVGVFSFFVHLVTTGRHYHSLVAKSSVKVTGSRSHAYYHQI